MGDVTTANRWTATFLRELKEAARRHRWLMALVALYWGAGLCIAHLVGLPGAATLKIYLPIFVEMMPSILVALFIGRCVIIVVVERPQNPLRRIGADLRHVVLAPRRIADGVLIVACMLLFSGTFTLIKAAMPRLNTYDWDVRFEALDRWIHGNRAPWELLQPLLGHPAATQAVNVAYAAWFVVLCLFWVWQAFSQRDSRLRQQFFWTLLLIWIVLGNVAATYFASAGPCYFGRMTGLADPFSALMDYLHRADATHPIWALRAQDLLWQRFLAQDVQVAAGISAMPSIHVAIATLFILLGWRTSRVLGMAMTVYALIIMIGSVHLGWHYAIDGYLGALGTFLIWRVVGLCLSGQASDSGTGQASNDG